MKVAALDSEGVPNGSSFLSCVFYLERVRDCQENTKKLKARCFPANTSIRNMLWEHPSSQDPRSGSDSSNDQLQNNYTQFGLLYPHCPPLLEC